MSDHAYTEAQKRIREWEPGRKLDLAIHGLDRIPPEIAELEALEELVFVNFAFFAWADIQDLTALSALTGLQSLDFSHTEVADLSPLSGLTGLKSLDCICTQVTDLSPLSGLTGLQSLDCSDTKVRDLSPLSSLTGLQSFDCIHTQVTDLSPLSGLTSLQSLDCSWTQITDLSPLSGLTNLQSLDCSYTRVADLPPLSSLTNLQSLNCSDTKVTDLSPLSSLTNLQSLHCSLTLVTDLSPLSDLTDLQSLTCVGAPVTDLSPLSSLTGLQSLDCIHTPVTDLSPLSGLTNLQSLDCIHTQVTDLSPLSSLTNLRSLDFSHTQVKNLSPLSKLTGLQSLHCSETKTTDLSPLSELTSLQSLHCSETKVTDLSPLSKLTNLQSLACFRTKITDLSPILGLTKLASIDISGCSLRDPYLDLWMREELKNILLYQTTLPGIPPEVLSDSPNSSCLEELQAHIADLGDDPVKINDGKLMVLGNGRAGKTQIYRRLRDEEFDEDVSSTHGIVTQSANVPSVEGNRFHVWDFGGQDIYHSTHSLFIGSRAAYLVVWSSVTEDEKSHETHGMAFRNYPLPYWINYVRRSSGDDVPLIVVQNQADEPGLDQLPDSKTQEMICAFDRRWILSYSAKKDRQRASLNEALWEAYGCLNQPLIGQGRAEVKRWLEGLRDNDFTDPDDGSLRRTMDIKDFEKICVETGGISDAKMFLKFLNDAGTVFYREGIFNDKIILDQGWALEAIYTIFNRDRCIRLLRAVNGRFTLQYLRDLVWEEQGYSPDEQRLFISMMESCGICFPLGYRYADRHGMEYVAPDLLAEDKPIDGLCATWNDDTPCEKLDFKFDFLSPALMHGIMGRVGSGAGRSGQYWRHGVAVFESRFNSHAIIEESREEDWSGLIRLRTRDGQAAKLLARMRRLIEQQIGTYNLSAEIEGESHPIREDRENLPDETPTLNFDPEPRTSDEYFVSYAWKDDRTDAGKKREEKVDAFCAEAERRGIKVIRDKTELARGDSISAFMDRIGAGDRVFIFLSDKYLHSPNCMHELTELWETSGYRAEEFQDRVRILKVDDCNIWTIKGRLKIARYWRDELDGVNEAIRENGVENLGQKDMRRYAKMKAFAHRTGDILAEIADHLIASSFEEFVENGFDFDDDEE